MKYEYGQEVILPSGIFQIPTQAAIPDVANDRPICCDERYGRNGIVWFNNSMPRWVSDPKSNPNHNVDLTDSSTHRLALRISQYVWKRTRVALVEASVTPTSRDQSPRLDHMAHGHET